MKLTMMTWDCTQRELVYDIATVIYQAMGHTVLSKDLSRFECSRHPQGMAAWAAAETIYELFMGDSPDYGDDPDPEQ